MDSNSFNTWDPSIGGSKKKGKRKMPLIKSKSKKALKENIRREVKAGKPVKQAAAIAYSMKRGGKKAKKRKGSYQGNT